MRVWRQVSRKAQFLASGRAAPDVRWNAQLRPGNVYALLQIVRKEREKRVNPQNVKTEKTASVRWQKRPIQWDAAEGFPVVAAVSASNAGPTGVVLPPMLAPGINFDFTTNFS